METMHAAGRRRLPPVPRPTSERTSASAAVLTEPATEEFASTTELIDTRQISAELIDAELAALTAPQAPVAVPPPPAAADDDPIADAATDDDGSQADTSDDWGMDDTARFDLSELPDERSVDEPPVVPATAWVSGAVVEPVVDEVAPLAVEDEVRPQVFEPVADEVELPTVEPLVDVVPEAAEPAVDEQDPAQQFVARLRSSATDFAGAAGAESAVVREAVPPARHRRARCRLVLRYSDGDVADVTLLGPAGTPGRPSRHGFDRQILRWLGAGLVRDDAWVVDDPDAPDGVAVDLGAWVAAG
jgi:hypothetical protein